jgi:hypothetical protein
MLGPDHWNTMVPSGQWPNTNMEEVMGDGETDKVVLTLTPNQEAKLSQAFGEEFASKVRGIEVLKVEGQAQAHLLKN